MKKRTQSSTNECSKRSECPIACTLDLIGDKWTLLVVRDFLFLGKRLYSELIQGPESIPSNILADRLKRLEEAGLLEKHPYQQNPVRYEYRLTAKGSDLYPVLIQMIRWGNRHIPGTGTLPKSFFEAAEKQIAVARKRARQEDIALTSEKRGTAKMR
mgnify:CR=1 FL=1